MSDQGAPVGDGRLRRTREAGEPAFRGMLRAAGFNYLLTGEIREDDDGRYVELRVWTWRGKPRARVDAGASSS